MRAVAALYKVLLVYGDLSGLSSFVTFNRHTRSTEERKGRKKSKENSSLQKSEATTAPALEECSDRRARRLQLEGDGVRRGRRQRVRRVRHE